MDACTAPDFTLDNSLGSQIDCFASYTARQLAVSKERSEEAVWWLSVMSLVAAAGSTAIRSSYFRMGSPQVLPSAEAAYGPPMLLVGKSNPPATSPATTVTAAIPATSSRVNDLRISTTLPSFADRPL